MLGSLALGVALMAGGTASGSDIGSLAAAYGSLVIGASLFLGVGLAIQSRVQRAVVSRKTMESRTPPAIMGHRVF